MGVRCKILAWHLGLSHPDSPGENLPPQPKVRGWELSRGCEGRGPENRVFLVLVVEDKPSVKLRVQSGRSYGRIRTHPSEFLQIIVQIHPLEVVLRIDRG